MIIIDNRMRDFEKFKLKSLDKNLYEINKCEKLYPEISSHVDIHCCKIGDQLIVSNHILNIQNCIYGESNLSSTYPNDIAYNLCIIGKNAIHNFKYTDKKILELLDIKNYNKINIKQGYSKCSIAVIDSNSAIVTDSKIANILSKNNIDVLLLDKAIEKNIHLLNNNNYSTMTGFIGGCISRIDDYIFVSGDLSKIDVDNKIRTFISNKGLSLIDFPGEDIIDYGGIIKSSN